ncbi:hypothetical protein Tco_1355651, partial [Tanacetum coccineum]
ATSNESSDHNPFQATYDESSDHNPFQVSTDNTLKSSFEDTCSSDSTCSPLSSIIIADWKTIFDEIPACLTTLPHHRILDLTGNQHRICYFTYLGFVKEDETVIVSSNKNQEARDLLQLRW